MIKPFIFLSMIPLALTKAQIHTTPKDLEEKNPENIEYRNDFALLHNKELHKKQFELIQKLKDESNKRMKSPQDSHSLESHSL